MFCPNCHLDQAPGVKKCPKCGVVFADWQKSLEPDAVEPDEKPISPLYPLLAVILVGLAGWWLFFPVQGHAVPKDAFLHDYCRFAVTTIPAWELARGATQPLECSSGDRVFGAPIGFVNKPVMGFRMKGSLPVGHMRPVFMVIVAPTQLPVLTDSARRLQADDFWNAVRLHPEVAASTPETSGIVVIDNLEALRLTGTIRFASSSGETRVVVTAVPGAGRTYILFWAADAAFSADPRIVKSLDYVLWSFRVVDRPINYGGAVKAMKEEAVRRGVLSQARRKNQRPLAGALATFLGALKG
ncbi:MAG: zinc ribbon domain-containing protein [Elusimicrobiota bacterium]|jgi:hypothetical protein